MFELELELLLELELEAGFEVLEVPDDVVDFDEAELALCPEVGDAALVVGTVRGGTPLVSFVFAPLPPHAATAMATSNTAPVLARIRRIDLPERCLTLPSRVGGQLASDSIVCPHQGQSSRSR